jgi:type II secretory ATPase GspE/PulE/Tfp pilus assembly ATPase PilB-like protein
LSSHGTHEELSSLGLNSPQKQLIQDLLQRTHGMTLVTGPTGSGKTTTLYACLNYLKNAQLSIATLEDPIEYAIGHINQVPVNDKTGFTFHRGLRALLRQDPDVIMVGEIRDQETAELATNAALTGHRIFSTLHTNDAISTIPRLMDMGIEPYIITSSLNAVLSQRLTRLLCTKCKQPAPITTSQWVTFCKYLSLPTHTPKTKLFTNAGCTVCNGTGYLGRTGIYEILTLNDALREAIIKRAPIHIIRLLIAKHGMKTMREDGWEKVKQGQISIHELMRVLHD